MDSWKPVAVGLILLTAGTVIELDRQDTGLTRVEFYSGDERLASANVEVADTDEERREGLMNRTSLESDGMLFVFDREQELSFWMKNTYIPLDMVFVYRNGTISRIYEADPQPGVSKSELRRYRARGKYVVELRQGFTDEHGIEEGDRVEIPVE